MQEVAKQDLLPPGVCHLCNGAPSDGEKIVDTLKNFVTGFPTGKEGRIYVCESCIRAFGEVIGLEAGDKVAAAEARAALAEARLNAVRDHIVKTAKQLTDGSLDFAQTASEAAIVVESAAVEAVEEKPKKKPAAKKSEADGYES
jgi:hypothetical protein